MEWKQEGINVVLIIINPSMNAKGRARQWGRADEEKGTLIDEK
jgi:hypothetical protein